MSTRCQPACVGRQLSVWQTGQTGTRLSRLNERSEGLMEPIVQHRAPHSRRGWESAGRFASPLFSTFQPRFNYRRYSPTELAGVRKRVRAGALRGLFAFRDFGPLSFQCRLLYVQCRSEIAESEQTTPCLLASLSRAHSCDYVRPST